MSPVNDEQWWWDLEAGRAVSDHDRGPDRRVLGPYATKEAAEAWQTSHQAREDAWKDDDDRWEEGEEPEGS